MKQKDDGNKHQLSVEDDNQQIKMIRFCSAPGNGSGQDEKERGIFGRHLYQIFQPPLKFSVKWIRIIEEVLRIWENNTFAAF